MNTKKIIFIVILIVFIIAIGAVLFNANNKAVEKIEDNISKPDKKSNDMVIITDNFFIEQTNDMFLNLKDYIGKTVKIEGLIYTYKDLDQNTYYAVVRNTPGCCGNDGLAGLDIRYDGEYPIENTWVEVTGVIEKEIVDRTTIPVIKVSSMIEKEKGKTFVTY